jgi:hypothetical protein
MPSRDDKAARRAKVAAFRDAEQRKSRRRRLLTVSIVVAAVAVLAGVGTIAVRSAVAANEPGPLPTPPPASGTAMPPWALPASPSAAIAAAGLEASSMEGGGAHFHPHLDILVNGKAVPVAADIGIDQTAGVMSELHTHDASGLIHIESPSTNGRYVLGQLFTEWGVRLDREHLGGLTTGSGKSLIAYVDGKRVQGNPAQVELVSHRQITLVFGATGQKVPVPSSYSFPPGA